MAQWVWPLGLHQRGLHLGWYGIKQAGVRVRFSLCLLADDCPIIEIGSRASNTSTRSVTRPHDPRPSSRQPSAPLQMPEQRFLEFPRLSTLPSSIPFAPYPIFCTSLRSRAPDDPCVAEPLFRHRFSSDLPVDSDPSSALLPMSSKHRSPEKVFGVRIIFGVLLIETERRWGGDGGLVCG